jgi:hypothetical protein
MKSTTRQALSCSCIAWIVLGSGWVQTLPQAAGDMRAIARAKDWGAALNQVFSATFDIFPYVVEALVEHGKIVPHLLVVGRELGRPLGDLSEPQSSREVAFSRPAQSRNGHLADARSRAERIGLVP